MVNVEFINILLVQLERRSIYPIERYNEGLYSAMYKKYICLNS